MKSRLEAVVVDDKEFFVFTDQTQHPMQRRSAPRFP